MKTHEEFNFMESHLDDGQWLSPIPEERAWQEEKLKEIFGHYPNSCPKWQYLNGLILIAIKNMENGRN